MRSFLILGCVVASAAGCETTKPALVNCVPCKTHKTSCMVSPATPAAAPAKPATLPPTIKEVRSEDPEPRQFATTPVATPASVATPSFTPPGYTPPVTQAPVQQPATNNTDVLLIPRWVYVPYSPHQPNGPTRLPGNMNTTSGTAPYMVGEDRMTVLPPMGVNPQAQVNANANAAHAAMMEQCLQQMKMLNQRIGELEAKNTAAPAPAVVAPAKASTPLPNPPQMLPLPPPLPTPAAPFIPPAK